MSENLKLENQLCFPIYALSRQITALYRPHLDKMEITYPQYLVLLVLWEHATVSVKDLGKRLWLDSGTLTPLLKRMESGGLVIRERSNEDERIVNIIITDKGKRLENRAKKIPPIIKEDLKMNDSQLSELRSELNRILNIAGKCDTITR